MSSAHSPTFSLLHLHHSSFSNPSLALPTSQLILQPFHCFTHITAHSPTLSLLHLRHSSFSTPSFASPTPQALHLIHLASRAWKCYSRGSWHASQKIFTDLKIYIVNYVDIVGAKFKKRFKQYTASKFITFPNVLTAL